MTAANTSISTDGLTRWLSRVPAYAVGMPTAPKASPVRQSSPGLRHRAATPTTEDRPTMSTLPVVASCASWPSR